MTWGYERGRSYNRQRDIHGRFGGQEQGGIITPAQHALVIAITSERGRNHGYQDRELPDGSFEYFGAGRFGDMEIARGNEAILNHSANSKSLLLFRNENNGHTFLGEYVCSGYELRRAADEAGAERNAIVFRLWPLENINEQLENASDLVGVQAPDVVIDLDELGRRAFNAARPSVPGNPQTRTVYERSRDVARYVLARASGRCEYDGEPAPFLRDDGAPYLEPHHIERLSDGGPDDPRFVIALCPNCHRRAHSGADRISFKAELISRMQQIETRP